LVIPSLISPSLYVTDEFVLSDQKKNVYINKRKFAKCGFEELHKGEKFITLLRQK